MSVVGFQRLDHDLLLAEQVIHEQSDAAAVALGDHDQALVQRTGARLDTEQLMEADDGEVVAAEREDFIVSGQAADARLLESHRLDDGDERNDVGLAADRH